MDRCLRVAVSLEANAASKSRRAASAATQQTPVSTSNATVATSNVAGKPTNYKGKAIDNYGYFKDNNHWGTLASNEKKEYYKQLNKWIAEGLILQKPRGAGASNNRKAVLKELMADMKEAISNDTVQSQSTASTPSTASPSTNNDVNENDKVFEFPHEYGSPISLWNYQCPTQRCPQGFSL